jgi:S-adenosylmethionine:tRNA ribosyltransferase-isomerase
MRTDQLDYDLPAELIAQTPLESRCDCRLLVLNRTTGAIEDRIFTDLAEYLRAGDCLVLNDTKVLPARFFATRTTGARLEGLFLDEHPDSRWEVMLKNSRKVKPGEQIVLLDRDSTGWGRAQLIERFEDGRWLIEVPGAGAREVLSQIGLAPLPPYIKRAADDARNSCDIDDYQTVYAELPGAIAAPTAGLHFTAGFLEELQAGGIRTARITLHVGAGTFKPVKTELLEDHRMHYERFSVGGNAAEVINQTRQTGNRIIAVGTTSVRTLETLAVNGPIAPSQGRTNLFILPGYEFGIVDAMVTNFHLPRSTLLALVGALAGLDNVLKAYRHAVRQRYRFYSYGDAMLII